MILIGDLVRFKPNIVMPGFANQTGLIVDAQPWQHTVTVAFEDKPARSIFETTCKMAYLDIVGDAGGQFKLKNPAKQKAFADSLNENRRYRAGQMVRVNYTPVKQVCIIIEEIEGAVISILCFDVNFQGDADRRAVIQVVPSMIEFIGYEDPAIPPPRRKAKPEAA